MRMTIRRKLILGFMGVAWLVVVVGFYGLSANNRITQRFAEGEEHFISIVTAATE